nr:hypothetical protein B0A51_16987 [Rachicladosporium sp. CCFEE 5018]
MAASLVTLPSELLEVVASTLDVNDLGGLRLTCRDVAVRISNGAYKSHFKSKRLLLSVDKLTRLEQAARQVGPLIANEDDLTEQRVDECASGLAAAWHALRRLTDKPCLQHLILEVDTQPSYAWVLMMTPARPGIRSVPDQYSSVIRSAQSVYRVVIKALAECGEALHSLNLFGTLPRCSLPMRELHSGIAVEDAACWTGKLEHLTLSVASTERPQEGDEPTIGAESAQAMPPVPDMHPDARSVLECLTNTLRLVSLDLGYYEAHERVSWDRTRRYSAAYLRSMLWFDSVADRVLLPRLITLRLRNVRTSESSLTGLLTRHSLRDLTMEYIHLQPGGKFQRILNIISGPKRKVKLSRLALADLWEERLMRFALSTSDHQSMKIFVDGHRGPRYAFTGELDELEKTVKIFRDTTTWSGELGTVEWLEYCRNMSIALKDLPPELFDQFADVLDLPTLCRLRLANRATSRCILVSHYATCFISKRLLLTPKKLSSFTAVIKSGSPVCALESLTLVSPMLQKGKDLREKKIQELSSLLLVALQALSVAAPQCLLRHLEFGVDTHPKPARVRADTQWTSKLVHVSVYPNNSRIEAWNIFTDFHAVSDLLRLTPNLESLSIRHLMTDFDDTRAGHPLNYKKKLFWFDTVAETLLLPKLASLSFHNVRISQELLLKLLTRHPIRRLTIEYMALERHEFDGIMGFISGPDRTVELEHLALADLWGEYRFLPFEVPYHGTRAGFGFARGEGDRYVFVGGPTELQELVRCEPQGDHKHSMQSWEEERALHFGPP